MRSVTTDYGGVAKLVFAASPFSNTLIGFYKKSPFQLSKVPSGRGFLCLCPNGLQHFCGLIAFQVFRARCSSLRGVP